MKKLGVIKPNNSKGLEINDIVRHDRGWIGRVRKIEYCQSDECEVDWFGEEKNLASPMTSIKFLTIVEYANIDEVIIRKLV